MAGVRFCGGCLMLHQDILDNSMLPSFWEQIVAGASSSNMTVHLGSKTWMTESCVNKLDWAVKNPDLNLMENLWDELGRSLRARQLVQHQCVTSHISFWKDGHKFPFLFYFIIYINNIFILFWHSRWTAKKEFCSRFNDRYSYPIPKA